MLWRQKILFKFQAPPGHHWAAASDQLNQQVAFTQFGINSLNNIKIFNYRSNFQHFLKHLPFSSAACQPNADTWEKKSSPWCPEGAERKVHTIFCLCSILHVLCNAAILKHQFHKNLSWIDSVCPGFEPTANLVPPALHVSADLLRWYLITWKLSGILLMFQNWNFVCIKHSRKKSGDFSGHNYKDNDKGINKTPSPLCICLRHRVSATDL